MNRREQWSVGEHPALDLRVPVGVVEVHVGDAGILQVELESAAAAARDEAARRREGGVQGGARGVDTD